MRTFPHGSALLSFLALFSVFLSGTIAADNGNGQNVSVDWIWPAINYKGPPGSVHTYNVVDILNASWTSNLAFKPILVVWCQAPGGWTANQSSSVPSNGSHLQSLDLQLPQGYKPASCHLDFDNPESDQLRQPSGTFLISNASDPSPQIWSGASSSASAPVSASATATSASNTLPPLPPDSTTSDSDSTNSGSGIGGGAIAGIVIGVLFGLGLVIGALVFFVLRRRRRRIPENGDRVLAADNTEKHRSEMEGYAGGELAAGEKPWEKDSVQQPVEVPGDPIDAHQQGPVELEGNQSFLAKNFSRKSKKSVKSAKSVRS